jgi:hypothetical protein
MENRKYPRLDVDLPMGYLIHSPDSGKSFAGLGVLKNICQGGMFFKCPPPVPIDDGDIRNFTVDTIPIMRHVSRLKALGKVVRIEPPEENSFDYGIAVQFLSDLNVELRRQAIWHSTTASKPEEILPSIPDILASFSCRPVKTYSPQMPL